MRPATYHLSIRTVRADALFASALQRSDEPSEAQVRRAIAGAIRVFGARGCAARVGDCGHADALGAGGSHRYFRQCPGRAYTCHRAGYEPCTRRLPGGLNH